MHKLDSICDAAGLEQQSSGRLNDWKIIHDIYVIPNDNTKKNNNEKYMDIIIIYNCLNVFRRIESESDSDKLPKESARWQVKPWYLYRKVHQITMRTCEVITLFRPGSGSCLQRQQFSILPIISISVYRFASKSELPSNSLLF